MKSIKLFGIFSMILMMTIIFTSCDQEQVDNRGVIVKKASEEDLLGLRSCTVSCPLGDCCCAVYMQEGEDLANLVICGTSNFSGNCTGSAVGSCASFSGGGASIPLDDNTPRVGFCMNLNSPFWIANIDDEDEAIIYLTCQETETSPQILQITIPAGERWYYTTDGDCELSSCN